MKTENQLSLTIVEKYLFSKVWWQHQNGTTKIPKGEHLGWLFDRLNQLIYGKMEPQSSGDYGVLNAFSDLHKEVIEMYF